MREKIGYYQANNWKKGRDSWAEEAVGMVVLDVYGEPMSTVGSSGEL